MEIRWSAEQVLALAPDASSVPAGRKLAAPGPWSVTGTSAEPAVVWGECRGSGKTPYRTAVDLTGPAFSCSCPSRKFPCKHALGLLLQWSSGAVPDAAPADWAAAWLAARQERSARVADRAGDRAAGASGPADPEAARRRAAQRRRRMGEGMAELDRWLQDQVRAGLAGADRAGYQPFDDLAARMVDAQLPAVAARVRQLASTAVSGEGWPGRLLQEYALLHLLARAAPGAVADPAPGAGAGPAAGPRPGPGAGPGGVTGPDGVTGPGEVAGPGGVAGSGAEGVATVRAHLGIAVTKDDVLARAGVRDRWWVLASRDDVEDRLSVRRVWLRGERGGRTALVLSYAAGGQALDASLVPGTVLDADLHFYPGAVPLRALVGARHGPAVAADDARGVPGVGLEEALDAHAAALAGDPWLRSWPVVLAGVVPVLDDPATGSGPAPGSAAGAPGPGGRPAGGRWWLVDDGGALPMVDVGDLAWTLLAASGGRPTTLLAEIVPDGVRALAPLPAAAS